MADRLKDLEDSELVNEAYTGNQSKAEGAQIEMMRRLKGSIDNLKEETSRHSIVMRFFTLALIVLGVFQIIVSIVEPEGFVALFWMAVSAGVVWAVDYSLKKVDKK